MLFATSALLRAKNALSWAVLLLYCALIEPAGTHWADIWLSCRREVIAILLGGCLGLTYAAAIIGFVFGYSGWVAFEGSVLMVSAVLLAATLMRYIREDRQTAEWEEATHRAAHLEVIDEAMRRQSQFDAGPPSLIVTGINPADLWGPGGLVRVELDQRIEPVSGFTDAVGLEGSKLTIEHLERAAVAEFTRRASPWVAATMPEPEAPRLELIRDHNGLRVQEVRRELGADGAL